MKPVISSLKKTLKPVTSSWTKVKSMQLFEKPGDTTEISRLRLEFRQAVLKGVGYLFLYIFIALVILPNPSTLEIVLPIVTFVVLGSVEWMKANWLFKVLVKKNPP